MICESASLLATAIARDECFVRLGTVCATRHQRQMSRRNKFDLTASEEWRGSRHCLSMEDERTVPLVVVSEAGVVAEPEHNADAPRLLRVATSLPRRTTSAPATGDIAVPVSESERVFNLHVIEELFGGARSATIGGVDDDVHFGFIHGNAALPCQLWGSTQP